VTLLIGAVVIVLIIFLLCILLFTYFPFRRSSLLSPETKLREYEKHMRMLFATHFPSQDNAAKTTLHLAGKAFLNTSLGEPVVILLAGRQMQVDCFSRMLTRVWNVVLQAAQQPAISGDDVGA
jgi:hypothetical protein